MPGIQDTGPIVIPVDRLQFGEVVGEGSTGSVKYAKHCQWGEVAVKLLETHRPGLGKKEKGKLQDETSKLRCLSHKHIVQLYGVVCEPNLCGLVMQFMKNGSLSQFLRNYDVPLALKVKFAYEIILGMNYLHTLEPPVIHRDLKSLNILIADDLSAKISDFGLAVWRGITKSHSSSRWQASARPPSSRAGTPAYIPPESWEDIARPPDEKFDVYAYGILLYEMLAEKDPYENVASLEHLILAVKAGQRPNMADIPADAAPMLQQLMQECWAHDPASRPSFSVMKEKMEPIYEAKYKAGVMDATLSIMRQMKEETENTDVKEPWQPPDGSFRQLVQPVSASETSGSDYPPIHGLTIHAHHGSAQPVADAGPVPVQSSNGHSGESIQGAMAFAASNRNIPSVLLGPNVPLPSEWPSNIASPGQYRNMQAPYVMNHGHVSYIGSQTVEEDCLNAPRGATGGARSPTGSQISTTSSQPQPPTGTPPPPYHSVTKQTNTGGDFSNIAVANSSSRQPSQSGDNSMLTANELHDPPARVRFNENQSIGASDGEPAAMIGYAGPQSIGDGRHQQRTPIPRFTVTDPKLQDYGAQEKLLSPKVHSTSETYRSEAVLESQQQALQEKGCEMDGPLTNPTQETSTPGVTQAIGGTGSTFNQYYEQLFMEAKVRGKEKGDSNEQKENQNFEKISEGGENKAVYNISNMASMQIGNHNVTYHHPPVGQQGQPQNLPPNTIKKKLKVPARMISNQDIKLVAQDLGSSWKELARQLGFSTGQIDAIEHDYHLDGLHEKIYQLLERWRSREAAAASVKQLLVNLINVGRPDIATKLASEIETVPVC